MDAAKRQKARFEARLRRRAAAARNWADIPLPARRCSGI
jgi:hypothetical protein